MYSNRNATPNTSSPEGGEAEWFSGMHRRSNAAWVLPQAGSSPWWNPGERRERRGPVLPTRRVSEEPPPGELNAGAVPGWCPSRPSHERSARRHPNANLSGTARRWRANGAVLLLQVVQTRPRITPQIRKVQGRAICRADKAPLAALSCRGADRRSAFQAVPALFRGWRPLTGGIRMIGVPVGPALRRQLGRLGFATGCQQPVDKVT